MELADGLSVSPGHFDFRLHIFFVASDRRYSALKGDLMLKTFYPSSLAIFGPIVDGFAAWLVEHRYKHSYECERRGF